MEQSERDRVREENLSAEPIYRRHDDIRYALSTPAYRSRGQYPWEEGQTGLLSKITKDYFRCKGSSLNPPITVNGNIFVDCGGMQRHSLPLRNDQEFIYPILLEILNYLQEKTSQKVVITSGYRCPKHNAYADSSPSSQASKHMIGAEVDFYLQGYESRPESVVGMLIQFFKEKERYKGKKEFEEFQRYEKGDTGTSTLPWFNKEIFIKLYKKGEGRDFDNRHPYPYISIQVRYDRDLNEKVTYSWPKANSCFKRN